MENGKWKTENGKWKLGFAARPLFVFHVPFSIFHFLLLVGIAGCTTPDPILEGLREPVFKTEELKITGGEVPDLGAELKKQECPGFTIDGGNRIWRNGQRIFAGLPTEAEIGVPKKVVCNGRYVYAGLSTGELVKVDSETRNLEWTADIFAARSPTKNALFLDIVAAPVYNAGYVYAGGLGGAFCKIRDSDGSKAWCLPISVQSIIKSTAKYNIVKAADGQAYAVSTDGKVYSYEL